MPGPESTPALDPSGSTPAWRNWARAVSAFAVLALLIALGRFVPLPSLLEWVRAQGSWAPALYILLYVVACVCFVPGSLLPLGAGILFGPIMGTFWTSIASTLGATASFLIGRFAAREWLQQKLSRYPRFTAIDAAVSREGWKIVGLLRLSPAFPFSLLNYALGLTGVRLRDYVLASWIGMLPATALYVYLGSLVGEALLSGQPSQRTRTPAEWALFGVGFAATALVTFQVTRIARSALNRRIG